MHCSISKTIFLKIATKWFLCSPKALCSNKLSILYSSPPFNFFTLVFLVVKRMQLFKYVATASPSIVQQQNFANENILCSSSSCDLYINMQSKAHIHSFQLNNNKLYYIYFQGIYIYKVFFCQKGSY